MRLKHRLIRLASKTFNRIRLIGHHRHLRNIRSSRAVLPRLACSHDGAVINYLRQVDPFVLEELVLTILEERGVFVLRGSRYSGDGGVDGRFHWPGRGWHAVQVKRYSSAIDPAHVRSFSYLVREHFAGGVFVHTGRTGPMSMDAIRQERLHLLSGSGLAQCVKGLHPLRMLSRRQAALG